MGGANEGGFVEVTRAGQNGGVVNEKYPRGTAEEDDRIRRCRLFQCQAVAEGVVKTTIASVMAKGKFERRHGTTWT